MSDKPERVSGEVVKNTIKQNAHKFANMVENPSGSPFQKFLRTFLDEDLPSAAQHTLTEYAIPTVKDFMANFAVRTIDRMFGRGSRGTAGGARDFSPIVRTVSTQATNYNQVSTQKASQGAKPQSPKKVSLGELIYDRDRAYELAGIINTELEESGSLSVYELYELITPEDASMPVSQHDTRFGWLNKLGHRAEVHPYGSDYRVSLPRPVEI